MDLNVCEFFVTLFSAFAPVSALANSAWRERVVWFNELVNKAHSTSDLVDDFLAFALGKYFPAKSIFALIC